MSVPQWLLNYTSWHSHHRHSHAVNFVMYSCHARMKGIPNICGGHGNRFRQIIWTLRVAAASKRVLLVDWVSPEFLTDFLEPAGKAHNSP